MSGWYRRGMRNRRGSIKVTTVLTVLCVLCIAAFAILYFQINMRPERTVRTGRGPTEAGMDGEAGTRSGSTMDSALTDLNGEATYNGVESLQLNVRNGELDCRLDESLPPDTVTARWQYRQDDGLLGKLGGKFKEGDVEFRAGQKDGKLVIEDWCVDNMKKLGISIDLEIRHGADIGPVDINQGNGTVGYSGNSARNVNLGNGEIDVNMAATDDLSISLGNGQIDAGFKATAGEIDVSVGNGQIEVTLRDGSSVKVDASTGIGDITAPSGVTVSRESMLGATAKGRIGGGDATLDLSVGNGSIDIYLGEAAEEPDDDVAGDAAQAEDEDQAAEANAAGGEAAGGDADQAGLTELPVDDDLNG